MNTSCNHDEDMKKLMALKLNMKTNGFDNRSIKNKFIIPKYQINPELIVQVFVLLKSNVRSTDNYILLTSIQSSTDDIECGY